MSSYTHTGHTANGNRAGDETETFVQADIKICNPWKKKKKFCNQLHGLRTVILVNNRTYIPSS